MSIEAGQVYQDTHGDCMYEIMYQVGILAKGERNFMVLCLDSPVGPKKPFPMSESQIRKLIGHKSWELIPIDC